MYRTTSSFVHTQTKEVAVQLAAGQLLSSMHPPQMSITKTTAPFQWKTVVFGSLAKKNIVMNATGKA